MTPDELRTPPTAAEVANMLSVLDMEAPTKAKVARRLAFQRDSLLAERNRLLAEKALWKGVAQVGDRLEGVQDYFLKVANERVAELQRLYDAEAKTVDRLLAAIRKHRDQKADDRCHLDDDELYAALGDGVRADRTMPPKEKFLANCERFYDRRCERGDWPSYQELEAELDRLRALLRRLEWLDPEDLVTRHPYCPVCRELRPVHDPDCALAAELKGKEG